MCSNNKNCNKRSCHLHRRGKSVLETVVLKQFINLKHVLTTMQ